MQLPETEIGSSDLYRAVEESIVSSPILPLTGTVMSQNPGIPVSRANPSSYAQAAGSSSTPPAQPDRQLSSVPDPDGRDSGTLMH